MSTEYETTETLDVKGLSCPMPVVKAKGAIDELAPGEVLEVLATDAASEVDIEGWAGVTDGVELLEQRTDEADGETVYQHYLRRTDQ